jgi:hypothetical protein
MAGKKPKPVAVSSEKDGSPFPDFDINESVARGTMPDGIVSQECLSSQAALGTSLRVHSHSQQRASPPNSDPFPLPTAPFLRFTSSSFNPSDHSLCMTPTPSLLQRSSTFGSLLGEVTGTGRKSWESSSPPEDPGFYSYKVLPTPVESLGCDPEKELVAEALLGLQPSVRERSKPSNDGAQLLQESSLLNKALSCKCKSSKCLKLYCMCFSAGVFCGSSICKCQDCHNVDGSELLSREPGSHPASCLCTACRDVKSQKMVQLGEITLASESQCACKNSNCLQLYCLCFQAGSLCNATLCKCFQCLNTAKENLRGGARRQAVASCLMRRRDAFDPRPKKRSAEKGCSCQKSQ